MAITGATCGIAVDGEHCIIHVVANKHCYIISVVLSSLLSGLHNLASMSDEMLAVAHMEPDVDIFLGILWECTFSRSDVRRQLLGEVDIDTPLQTRSEHAVVAFASKELLRRIHVLDLKQQPLEAAVRCLVNVCLMAALRLRGLQSGCCYVASCERRTGHINSVRADITLQRQSCSGSFWDPLCIVECKRPGTIDSSLEHRNWMCRDLANKGIHLPISWEEKGRLDAYQSHVHQLWKYVRDLVEEGGATPPLLGILTDAHHWRLSIMNGCTEKLGEELQKVADFKCIQLESTTEAELQAFIFVLAQRLSCIEELKDAHKKARRK